MPAAYGPRGGPFGRLVRGRVWSDRSVIIDQATYHDGVRRSCFDLSDSLDEIRSRPDTPDFLWIGLNDPTQAEFDNVNDELRLHPLAVEDVLKGLQRAKVERYDDTLFVVLKTLRYVDATSDVETGEVVEFDSSGPEAEVFARQVAEQRQRREASLRKLRMDYVNVRTDRPYVDALVEFFRARARRAQHV